MSIEEAEYILNEAVITEPCIKSYTYISAEEINEAIDKMLAERLKDEKRIKELENNIVKEKNKLENIIREKDLKIKNYIIKIDEKKEIHLKDVFKYIKKLIKPPFLLENRTELRYNPKE